MSQFESRDPLVRTVLRNQIAIMDALHRVLEIQLHGPQGVAELQNQLRKHRETTIKTLEDDYRDR